MTPVVTSPCIGVCRMDELTGWCAGCLRTLDEIAAWSMLDEPARQAVCAELGRRRVAWRQHRRNAAAGRSGSP